MTIEQIAQQLWEKFGLKWEFNEANTKACSECEKGTLLYERGSDWLTYSEDGISLQVHRIGAGSILTYTAQEGRSEGVGTRLRAASALGRSLYSSHNYTTSNGNAMNTTRPDSLDDVCDLFINFITNGKPSE